MIRNKDEGIRDERRGEKIEVGGREKGIDKSHHKN